MTFLLGLTIFVVGGTLGLFIGCALAVSSRFDLMDDLDAADAEIDRLRGA
jgi:hypothetical protein